MVGGVLHVCVPAPGRTETNRLFIDLQGVRCWLRAVMKLLRCYHLHATVRLEITFIDIRDRLYHNPITSDSLQARGTTKIKNYFRKTSRRHWVMDGQLWQEKRVDIYCNTLSRCQDSSPFFCLTSRSKQLIALDEHTINSPSCCPSPRQLFSLSPGTHMEKNNKQIIFALTAVLFDQSG